MSFRIENKYKIQIHKLSNLYEWIYKNNGIKLFPKRNIISIYFDNLNLSLYNDSIEGIVPRKKIRLRTYNNFTNSHKNYNLEIKINSVEGRFKTSEKIKDHVKLLKKAKNEEIFELTILSKMKIISGYSVNSFHQIIFHGGDVFSKVCLESSKDIEVSRSLKIRREINIVT